MLFYIKKESQSDYIISSQNSRIGSYIRLYMVLKDVLWSQWSQVITPFIILFARVRFNIMFLLQV